MCELLKLLFADPTTYQMGLLFLRVGIGCIFIPHGLLKFIGGKEEFLWAGQQMANLGITFWPLLWGVAAASSELFGGLCLVLGLGTRVAASFMTFTMLVAIAHHFAKGDPYGYWSYPTLCMIVFITFIIVGGGYYSVDRLILLKLCK